MTALLTGYRWLAAAAEPLLPALLRVRGRRGKEDATRLPERLGREPGERPAGRLIHLHGASVGETLSLLPLVQALRTAAPDAAVLVTSGTVTSAALLAERLPAGVLHRYAPVDAPGPVSRWTRRWRPDLSVFVESELWPNWLSALRQAGARTALVSARLSDASLRGWARAPRAGREVLGGFDLVLAQDDAMAAALASLSARDDGRLNLKLAGDPLPVDAALAAEVRRRLAGGRLLLAASTHPGEEEAVLTAHRAAPAATLVIAPRHPARGPEVRDLAGPSARLQSLGQAPEPGGMFVADGLGELGAWFELARGDATVFLGGSLVAGVGGHNPLEVIRAGAAVARGPHVENWREVYGALGDTAPVIADGPALAALWAADLADPSAVAARARRAAARAPAASDVAEVARRLLGLLP